jgi:hypothetical protein
LLENYYRPGTLEAKIDAFVNHYNHRRYHVALACSQPPEGRAKWTLRLLESKVVELNIVDHASDNTIGRVLRK